MFHKVPLEGEEQLIGEVVPRPPCSYSVLPSFSDLT